MNANVMIITPKQLNNKLRKLEKAAVYASLNLKTNWETEKPIYYNKPTWDYYIQMKRKMLYWPYNTTRNRFDTDGMYTNEMSKHLNMIRGAVAYESRGAPPQASGVKKRKVGNRSLLTSKSPPKSPPKSPSRSSK